MSAMRVSVLAHRANGPLHLDLVTGVGSTCPTWALAWAGPRLRLVRKLGHRRRYLTWSGPLAGGRGSVRAVGRGWLRGLPRAADWNLELSFSGFADKQLRRFLRLRTAAFPAAWALLLRGQGERVVQHRLMPRIPRHERLG
jgi:hypothetical protein